MTWDPFGTLGRALWIGGAQWAGKSTVANLLADRLGLTAYHHDYHATRAHHDRMAVHRVAAGLPPFETPDWTGTAPEKLAADLLAEYFPLIFDWILDDLRALVSGRPVLAEGWALRPDLVLPVCQDPGRMVVMVPTAGFRERQARELPRARAVAEPGGDPEVAQRARLARDTLLAADAVAAGQRLGVRVIEVDGTVDAAGVADEVAEHFSGYLVRDAATSY